ncbi:MAG: hypothetical protein EA401_03545 [Planctomycetota bacterium]|nr:MAG: hypothetical protein EA401_03545 [Planctomycetota bacterium]
MAAFSPPPFRSHPQPYLASGVRAMNEHRQTRMHRTTVTIAAGSAACAVLALLMALFLRTPDPVIQPLAEAQPEPDWSTLPLPVHAQQLMARGPVNTDRASVVDHDRIVAGDHIQERWLYDHHAGPRSLVRRVVEWRPDGQGTYRFRSVVEAVGDHFLIRCAPEMDADAVAALAAELGMQVRRQVGQRGRWLLSFAGGDLAAMDRAQAALATHPLIDSVEPDAYLYPTSDPDDPEFAKQWNLKNTGQQVRRHPLASPSDPDANWDATPGVDINLLPAWGITRGHRSIPIGVIDSGMDYHHEDLAHSLWRNPRERANGIDDSGSGKVDDLFGWDFVHDHNNPLDRVDVSDPHWRESGFGHGTMVSGVIAAQVDNGQGVAGVVPEAAIVPLRMMFWLSEIIPAIEYSADIGLPISNHSYGGFIDHPGLRDAFEYAGSQGQLLVVAAMNSARDLDNLPEGDYYDDEPLSDSRRQNANDWHENYTGWIWYPAKYNYDFQITVASVTPVNDLYKGHNYGKESVDIAAPGVGIWTTTRGGGYNYSHGTSFAAPHVAGVAALMLSVNPHLSPQQLRSMIMDSGTPHEVVDGRDTISSKRLNAHAAVLAALGEKTGVAHIRDWHISDDPADGATGNNDGFWNNGEVLAIRADLDILGLEATENMHLEVEVVAGPATVYGDGTITISSHNPGQSLLSDPLFLQINGDAANDSAVELRLHVHMDNSHGHSDTRIIYTSTSNSASGVVTSRDDDSPIAGAELTWSSGDLSLSTTTDSAGHYSLSLVEGEWQVRVQADGYVDTVETVAISGGVSLSKNFSMGNPLWDRDIEGITIHVQPGQSATALLPMANLGNADLVLRAVTNRDHYTRQGSADPGGTPWVWEDISNDPEAVDISDQGNSFDPAGPISLPFGFPFYDQLYEQVIPQQVGYVHFVAQAAPKVFSQVNASSFRMPSQFSSNSDEDIAAALAYLWSNLRIQNGGTAHYRMDEQRFILQLSEVPRAAGSAPVTVQLHLHRDGRIDVYYRDVGSPAYHTIGLQDDADFGQTEVHRTSFGGTGPSINDDTVWRLYPRLRLDVPRLTVGASQQEAYTLIAQAYDLGPGTYEHTLTITSNELSGGSEEVSVTIVVAEDAPIWRRIRLQRQAGHVWMLDPGAQERGADAITETEEFFEELAPADPQTFQALEVEAVQ